MKNKDHFILSLLACVTLFIGLSCGKGGSGYSSNPPGGGGGGNTANSISIYNMAYSPATKTVAKGTVVTWTNNDGYAHTVTSNDGTSFNSGNINGGGTYSYTANVAGTFDYHCTIHGLSMSGTLIVNP